MKQWQPLILVLALSATGAFAEEAEHEAEEEEAIERVCVNKRNINSFDAIDDQHVYIKATGTITFYSRCSADASAYAAQTVLV